MGSRSAPIQSAVVTGSTAVAFPVAGVAAVVLALVAVETVEGVLSESVVAAMASRPTSKWRSCTRCYNLLSTRRLSTTSIRLQRLTQATRTVVPSQNRQVFLHHSSLPAASPSNTSSRGNQPCLVCIPLRLFSESCLY